VKFFLESVICNEVGVHNIVLLMLEWREHGITLKCSASGESFVSHMHTNTHTSLFIQYETQMCERLSLNSIVANHFEPKTKKHLKHRFRFSLYKQTSQVGLFKLFP
jgi:hypothetical protein